MAFWLSYSLISIALSPFLTYIVLRVKNATCNAHPRMPALFHTDMQVIIVTNVLSQVLLMLWAFAVPLNFSFLVAVDVLLGIPVEHWLLKTVFWRDYGFYHVPGEIAKRKLRRRYALALMFAILIRSSMAALCVITQLPSAMNLSAVQCLMQLLLYTVMRTLFVDVVQHTEVSSNVVEEQVRTDSFVITDEEDEEDLSNHVDHVDVL